MKPIFLVLLALTTFALLLMPRHASAARVTLILRNVDTDTFDEWRIKPEHKFTRSTGKIGRDNDVYVQTWDVGDPGTKIRFWWSRLSGAVDATVIVNNYVVFQGRCIHTGDGKVRMIDTCGYPSVYKTGGSGPYLLDKPQCDVTYIDFNTSMLEDRFGAR